MDICRDRQVDIDTSPDIFAAKRPNSQELPESAFVRTGTRIDLELSTCTLYCVADIHAAVRLMNTQGSSKRAAEAEVYTGV